MFNKKGGNDSLEISESVLRTISDLAAIAADPKKLAEAARNVREQIALTDKEKEARKEYQALIAQYNVDKDQAIQATAELEEKERLHIERANETAKQLKQKQEDLEEKELNLKKKKEEHAELEAALQKRLDAVIGRESAADRKEHLLKEREESVAAREAASKEEEKKIRNALAALK